MVPAAAVGHKHDARLEADWERAVAIVGEPRARAWRFYLSGTIASFEASTIELFQVVFARTGNDAIPWTRQHAHTGSGRFGRGGEEG